MKAGPFLLLALVACGGDDEKPPKLMDTGWFDTDTTGVDPETCPDKLVTTVPEAGETGWYWRDRPEVFVETENPAGYEAWLQDASGRRLDTRMAWDGLRFTLEWDGWLEADTDYVLTVRDCAATHEIPFRTSSLGQPLAIDPRELQGRTYQIDLVGAEWVQPAALSAVVATYFTTPVLLGVKLADETQIDLVGAPGVTDPLGNVEQDTSASTWDFPMADFTEAPFLDARTAFVQLEYEDGPDTFVIPVEDFVFQGTFAADGSRIGGGLLSGLGDTRHLGELLNDPDNPGALCEIAAGLGVQCEACADGKPYCLQLVAEQIDGELVPGLTLVEQ